MHKIRHAYFLGNVPMRVRPAASREKVPGSFKPRRPRVNGWARQVS